MNTKSVLYLARLGLSGDRNAILDYLKNLAAESANKNMTSLHHGLVEIIKSYEGELILASGNASINSHLQSNLWFNGALQKRIDKIIDIFQDPTIPRDLKGKFNKILLYGPPGTGKTTLGFYIADRLNLPIEYVKVSDVISFRFGETLKNIATIFEGSEKSIIFIDEFDAFAKSRFDSNDVGELKRVVNSLIQTLDVLSKERIVIVATNLMDAIDPAILRRFHIQLQIPKLTRKDVGEYTSFLLESEFKGKIRLSKQEILFLNNLLYAGGLATVDSIRSIFDSALISVHIKRASYGSIADILEAVISDGMISSKTIKHISDVDPDLFKQSMAYLSNNISKSEAADLLGIHRNSLINYAKKI